MERGRTGGVRAGRARARGARAARAAAAAPRRRSSDTCTRRSPTRALSCAGVPAATVRPPREDDDLVGEIVGLVEVLRGQQRRRRPRPPGLEIACHISRRLAGSRPVVGSSRKITGRGTTRQAARSSRRRSRRSRCPTWRSAAWVMPKRSSSERVRADRVALGEPLQAAEQQQVLAPGEALVERRPAGRRARSARARRAGSPTTSWPPTSARPRWGPAAW